MSFDSLVGPRNSNVKFYNQQNGVFDSVLSNSQKFYVKNHELAKILLNRAFSFGGNGLDDGILTDFLNSLLYFLCMLSKHE